MVRVIQGLPQPTKLNRTTQRKTRTRSCARMPCVSSGWPNILLFKHAEGCTRWHGRANRRFQQARPEVLSHCHDPVTAAENICVNAEALLDCLLKQFCQILVVVTVQGEEMFCHHTRQDQVTSGQVRFDSFSFPRAEYISF